MKQVIAVILCACFLCYPLSTAFAANADDNAVSISSSFNMDSKTDTIYETVSFVENGAPVTITSTWYADGTRVITLITNGETETTISHVARLSAVDFDTNSSLRVEYPHEIDEWYAGEERFNGRIVSLTVGAITTLLTAGMAIPLQVAAGVATGLATSEAIGDAIYFKVKKYYSVLEIDPYTSIWTNRYKVWIYYDRNYSVLCSGPESDSYQTYGGPYV